MLCLSLKSNNQFTLLSLITRSASAERLHHEQEKHLTSPHRISFGLVIASFLKYHRFISYINIRVNATFCQRRCAAPTKWSSPSVNIPTLELSNTISHEMVFCWIDVNVVYSEDWWALTEWSVFINGYRKNTLVRFHKVPLTI